MCTPTCIDKWINKKDRYKQSLKMKVDAYWVTFIYLYICMQTNQTKQFKSQYAKSRHWIKHFTMNKAVQTFDKSKPSILPVIRIFVSRERGSEGYWAGVLAGRRGRGQRHFFGNLTIWFSQGRGPTDTPPPFRACVN